MWATHRAGTMPVRLVLPIVGRSPTRAQCDAGPLTESPVSVPSDASAKFADTAAALPPLDPAHRQVAVLCLAPRMLTLPGIQNPPSSEYQQGEAVFWKQPQQLPIREGEVAGLSGR